MDTITEPRTLSVSLTMTPEIASELRREELALQVAHAYTIAGTADEKALIANEANKELRLVKSRLVRLKDLKAGFVEPANQIRRNAEALFDPAIEALMASEKFLKEQLTSYDFECKRIAEDARRKREEEERRARQDAEAKAAAERARAEEIAREKQRQADEAEAARVKAEREGNTRAAAAAAAAKAKAEEQARAAIENGEAKAVEMTLAASAAPTVTVVPEATKLDGFSTRENWVAELAVGVSEDDAKLALAQAIASGRRDLIALLKLDMPAANRLAKAQRKNMNAPGLVAVNRPIAASRAA